MEEDPALNSKLLWTLLEQSEKNDNENENENEDPYGGASSSPQKGEATVEKTELPGSGAGEEHIELHAISPHKRRVQKEKGSVIRTKKKRSRKHTKHGVPQMNRAPSTTQILHSLKGLTEYGWGNEAIGEKSKGEMGKLATMKALKQLRDRVMRKVNENVEVLHKYLNVVGYSTFLMNISEDFATRIVEWNTPVYIPSLVECKNIPKTFRSRPIHLIRSYGEIIEEEIAFLEHEAEQLLSGETRERLNAWLLTRIRVIANSFLHRKGYDFGALPESYIDTSPKDINVVKKNITLLKEILDVDKNAHDTTSVIDQTRRHLYKFVRKFEDSSELLIRRYFSLSYGAPVVQQLNNLLVDADKNGMEKIRAALEVMRDVQHFKTMRSLDNIEEPPQVTVHKMKGLRDVNQVAITGLLFGCFYRNLKELDTALEIWGGQ